MLSISDEALRDGCDRARDLFLLARLQGPAPAAETVAAVFEALGIDADRRAALERTAADLVPVQGVPAIEAAAAASILTGVLAGLLIADSALPRDELDLPTARRSGGGSSNGGG
jgi:hypothetical protein